MCTIEAAEALEHKTLENDTLKPNMRRDMRRIYICDSVTIFSDMRRDMRRLYKSIFSVFLIFPRKLQFGVWWRDRILAIWEVRRTAYEAGVLWGTLQVYLLIGPLIYIYIYIIRILFAPPARRF
jgi:hypothetical protein